MRERLPSAGDARLAHPKLARKDNHHGARSDRNNPFYGRQQGIAALAASGGTGSQIIALNVKKAWRDRILVEVDGTLLLIPLRNVKYIQSRRRRKSCPPACCAVRRS